MARTVEVTAPTEEPLDRAKVRNDHRIDEPDDDDNILLLIQGAREAFERETNRQLITATYDYYIDDWEDEIEIPYPPLQSITSVKYYETLSTDVYETDTTVAPGLIRRKHWDNESWPSHQSREKAITIRFVCGYGDADDVPAEARNAMNMLIGHWNENKEAFLVGNYAREIPRGFKSAVNGLKVHTFK